MQFKKYILIIGLCFLAYGNTGWSQDTEDFEVWADNADLIEQLPEVDPSFQDSQWFLRMAVITGIAPEYMGADEYGFGYAPNIKIVWNDYLFINGRKFGVNLLQYDATAIGAFFRYTGGRMETNLGLSGLGNISRTVSAGAFFNYAFKRLRFKSELRQDIFSQSHGLLAKASLSTKVPYERPLFSVALTTTWTNALHTRTFYGVDARQAAASGLREFQPGAGLQDVSLTLSSGYELTKHWAVHAKVAYKRLLGDAADSPLVKDIGSANQFLVGAGLSYVY